MKVLVTGANGYIGRHVIKVLLDRHVEVIACDITTTEVDKRAERMSLNLFVGGVSALLSMLNSCASGVSVVNIDNGFGAGYLASMINHIGGTK